MLYTVIYVAPFYISPTLRSSGRQSRDAPSVIRSRVRAVGLTCMICTAITVYVLAVYGHATPRAVLRLLGIWPIDPLDVLKVLALVAVLFVGPLYESVVVDGDWRAWSLSSVKEAMFDNWIGYRNLVVAPASEELVFRSLTISIYMLAKVDATRIVFTTPLIFGLAHIHHLVEFLQSRTPDGRRVPSLPVWVNGVLRSLFQFAYTSIFGFFAAFVFLRTGNMFAAIAAHAFCNWMGVPRLYGRVGQFATFAPPPFTPDVAQGKRDDDSHSGIVVGDSPMRNHEEHGRNMSVMALDQAQNAGIGWTLVYYMLVVVGAVGFSKLLFPLTESPNALAAFSTG